MKKLNRKGFTLVELIVTIIIVSLVLSITTFGIISIIDKSREEKKIISQNSITAAANVYSEENDTGWKRPYGIKYDAFCVTVGELINKGLLNKGDEVTAEKDKNDFIIVKRDRLSLAISDKKFAETDEEVDICLGNIREAKVVQIAPNIKKRESWTDQIKVTFEKGQAYDENETAILIKDQGHACVYCSDGSSSCFGTDKEQEVEAKATSGNEMSCTIPKLSTEKTYNIVVRYNFSVDDEDRKIGTLTDETTKEIKKPTISQNGKTAQVTFDDTNIKEGQARHYFKSEKSGTTDKNVYACKSVNNGIGVECSTSPVKKLEAGKWYELRGEKAVVITYGDIETSKIDAEISDGTNFKDEDFVFKLKKITVKFYKNYASNIGGSTSEYKEVSCYAEVGKSCNIIAPSIIAPNNYKVVGYSTSSSATSSTWSVGTSKMVSSNLNYYAIISRTLTVKFYRNNVYMLDNSTDSYVTKTCTLYNGDTYCGVTSPTIKVNDGSKIIGYNTSSDGTYSECDSNSFCNVSKDTNYYAVVEKLRTITVTFVKQYAYSIGSSKEVCQVEANKDSCTIRMPSINAGIGREAFGWSMNANASGTSLSLINQGATINVSSDTTYYAITGYKVILRLYKEGASSSSYDKGSCYIYNSDELDETCAIQLPSASKRGYTFTGWTKSKDGSGRVYASGSYYNVSYNMYLNQASVYANFTSSSPSPSNDEEVINDYRYTCVNDKANQSGDKRTAIYHITTCSKSTGICKYDEKNKLSISGYPQGKDIEGNPTGKISKSVLSINPDCTSYHFTVDKNPRDDGNNGVLYCYSTPSTTSSKVQSYVGCAYVDGIYRLTLKDPNWYWDPNAKCYMPGTNLNNAIYNGCSDEDRKNPGSSSGVGAFCDRTSGLKCCWGKDVCYTTLYD